MLVPYVARPEGINSRPCAIAGGGGGGGFHTLQILGWVKEVPGGGEYRVIIGRPLADMLDIQIGERVRVTAAAGQQQDAPWHYAGTATIYRQRHI